MDFQLCIVCCILRRCRGSGMECDCNNNYVDHCSISLTSSSSSSLSTTTATTIPSWGEWENLERFLTATTTTAPAIRTTAAAVSTAIGTTTTTSPQIINNNFHGTAKATPPTIISNSKNWGIQLFDFIGVAIAQAFFFVFWSVVVVLFSVAGPRSWRSRNRLLLLLL